MPEPCKNCDEPSTGQDVCDDCRRDPETNNCSRCGKHLEGINYPYVCGACMKKEWDAKLAGKETTN